jgi:AcrR family transcriptional regulator
VASEVVQAVEAGTSVARVPRRQQLLGLAGQMFARQGFAGTGVDEIGVAAGISGPALYRHFANKQAILDAMIVEGMERLLDSVRAIDGSNVNPDQWLDDLIETRLDFSFGPDRYTFVVRRNEQDHISKSALRKLAAMEEIYWADWLRVMAALRPGVSTTVLRRAIYAVHVFIGHIALEEHVDEIDEVRAHIAAMVRAALFAEAVPRGGSPAAPARSARPTRTQPKAKTPAAKRPKVSSKRTS